MGEGAPTALGNGDTGPVSKPVSPQAEHAEESWSWQRLTWQRFAWGSYSYSYWAKKKQSPCCMPAAELPKSGQRYFRCESFENIYRLDTQSMTPKLPLRRS